MAGLRADRPGSMDAPLNDGAGCGGVMRVAPVGLVASEDPFELGCATAALTHGHPWAYLPAGMLAMIVAALVAGTALDDALDQAIERTREHAGHQGVVGLIERARATARIATPTPERVESLGGGWKGHDALAIGVYCVLATGSWTDAVLLAANHGGDCDSTASIAGSLAAIIYGGDEIPTDWIQQLDLREAVLETAKRLSAIGS
jgi:ADP-ribosylglycohydrolase